MGTVARELTLLRGYGGGVLLRRGAPVNLADTARPSSTFVNDGPVFNLRNGGSGEAYGRSHLGTTTQSEADHAEADHHHRPSGGLGDCANVARGHICRRDP